VADAALIARITLHFTRLSDPESEHWQWPLTHVDETESSGKKTAMAA